MYNYIRVHNHENKDLRSQGFHYNDLTYYTCKIKIVYKGLLKGVFKILKCDSGRHNILLGKRTQE